MILVKQKRGYVLLEVLVASCIFGFLILSGFHHQVQNLKKSAHEFERLGAINEARNLLERFRASPLYKDVEFNRWESNLHSVLPEVMGAYHCNADHFCEVSLRCGQEEFKLSALVY